MSVEIKNAVIESASLSFADVGFLDCWLTLDYGGTGQSFGGYALYLSKSWTHHQINSPAGHFISRCMEVAGVENFEKLKGRTIRVKCERNKVYAIGHIVKDDWFNPSEDFKAIAKAEGEAP